MRGQVGSFLRGRLRGKHTQPIENLDALKDQIFAKGAFTAQAKIELYSLASAIEAELATSDEVEYNKTAVHDGEDYDLSKAESAVWSSANSTVQQLMISLQGKPREDMNMTSVGTAMDGIREDIFQFYQEGTLTSENYQTFIETSLPNIIQRHVSPVIQKSTDEARF